MRLFAWVLLVTPVAALAANVRPDRPRILIGNGTGPGTSLATFKQRCTVDPAYQSRCRAALTTSGGRFPAISHAAAYLVDGTASRCTDAYNTIQALASDAAGSPDAHSFISNQGTAMIQLAVVRDWCDPVLSATQRSALEARITEYADWFLANGAPDVYHNDMNVVWSSVALAGLALKGTAKDARAQVWLAAADTHWKTVVFPALAYEGDWWHEGFTYVQPALGALALYASAWSSATDENLFAWAKTNANDLFNGYVSFYAHALRPDYRYASFGDVTDNKQTIELFSRFIVDLFTLGTGSPLGQGLSLEIAAKSRPGYDYSGADAYLLALFHDASKNGTAVARASLPTARWLSPGAADVAVMRSGWGPDDTWIYLSCGDYLGAHQHLEAGSFQVFKRSLLTGPSGAYDAFDSDHWANYYSQHSVHANTLAIQQPGEVFPTARWLSDPADHVNDGGQRVCRMNDQGVHFASPDLPTYLGNKSAGAHNETGDLKTFEHAACHDYVACDVTAAYRGDKAKEVTRQLVFLRPELIVVFDRVESTQASYDKRFLLHTPATPSVSGGSFSVTNGSARLLGRTLLPAGATQKTVTNFSVAGTAHPPEATGAESGGTRLEVAPATAATRDYFLHVFDATDSSRTALPATTLAEDALSATVRIDDGARTYTLRLDKIGALGGHLTVKTAAGATVCDQPLGAQATPPPDGGAGGVGGGTGGSGAGPGGDDPDGGLGATTSLSASKGSCAMSPADMPLPIGIYMFLLGIIVRRRPRADR